MMSEKNGKKKSSNDKNESNNFEKDVNLILEFKKNVDEEMIKSIQDKLENEKFTIIKRDTRWYLIGDYLSMLFEAELNGIVKFNLKDNEYKRFKLEDYIDLNDFDFKNVDQLTKRYLKKILNRNEKIRVCQFQIEENIQVLKNLSVPYMGKLYPAQSFMLLSKKKDLIDYYPLHDIELTSIIECLSSYFLNLCLIFLPIERLRSYFNEYIAIYFNFIDIFTKCYYLVILTFFITITVFDSITDHQIICLIISSINSLTCLIFIRIWIYNLNELSCQWYLDEKYFEKNFIKPQLDYKCNRLFHPSLTSIKLIARPDDNLKCNRQEKFTWIILFIILFIYLSCQINFFFVFLSTSNDRLFYPILFNYLISSAIHQLLNGFVSHRTDQEKYFTSKEHQSKLLIKLIIIDFIIYNTLPMCVILLGTTNDMLIPILTTQLFFKFFSDIILNLNNSVLLFFIKRINRLIRSNKWNESQFVINESIKIKFNNSDLISEYRFTLRQIENSLLYSSIYPKICLITFLNIFIRHLINFIRICFLCRRPLFEDCLYLKSFENILNFMILFCSLINLLNLDLFSITYKFNFTSRQINLIGICLIFLVYLISKILPNRSIRSEIKRKINQLERYTLFRLLDETNLNQTIESLMYPSTKKSSSKN